MSGMWLGVELRTGIKKEMCVKEIRLCVSLLIDWNSRCTLHILKYLCERQTDFIHQVKSECNRLILNLDWLCPESSLDTTTRVLAACNKAPHIQYRVHNLCKLTYLTTPYLQLVAGCEVTRSTGLTCSELSQVPYWIFWFVLVNLSFKMLAAQECITATGVMCPAWIPVLIRLLSYYCSFVPTIKSDYSQCRPACQLHSFSIADLWVWRQSCSWLQ